jgi:nitrogen fixation protein FixH
MVLMLAGLGTLARIATDDPSFAVESNYYQKAVAWDSTMAQLAENERLAWQAELAIAGGAVVVQLTDKQRRVVPGVNVTLEAFPNARANRVLKVQLHELTPGRYGTKLAVDRAGLWEFRLTAQRGTDRYTATLRQEVRTP